MRDILIRPPLRLELIWRENEVWRIYLGWSGEAGEGESVRESPFAKVAEEFFLAYLRGEGPVPRHLPLAWHRVQGFGNKVLTTLYNRVGPGEWISYSRLAELSGSPGSARAVGRVMSGNPWPLLIPCHRVLRRDRSLGGFSSGLETKRYLLRLEGIDPPRA
ncbi:MAG: MGMT family protein [Desulfohalobiaceae bacterium]|nr:MGMT family protein [Desulfohalobiaceae bacterium]